VPASVLGPHAPSNRINVGAIGVGRISRGHDMPGIWKVDSARLVAVCDLDAKRVEDGKRLVNDYYAKKTGQPYSGVTGYADYRDLLANTDIDAVVISTPDHWHALITVAAVKAGKDVYLQKPASLTIAEGRAMSDAVHRSGRIFQIGSQQRSSPQWRYAAELVRNGRIGQLKTVKIGLPGDRRAGAPRRCPCRRRSITTCGSAPRRRCSIRRNACTRRPGTGGRVAAVRAVRRRHDHRWGAHHLDCAHWAMDTEFTGPVESGARPSSRSPGCGTCTARSGPRRAMRTAST